MKSFLTFLYNISYKIPLDKFGRHATRSQAYNNEDFDIDSDNKEYLNMRNKHVIQSSPPIDDAHVVNKTFLTQQFQIKRG